MLPQRVNSMGMARAKTGKEGADVRSVLEALQRLSTRKDRDNLARFGITASNAVGVSMANIQKVAKRLGKNHELAGALWSTGVYEARMLACFVEEPERVTSAQMDRWRSGFDNWGICDTACFVLFDRTPHAWKKVDQWARLSDEFGKRAAFALLACLAGHDKTSGDGEFARRLALVEKGAEDERNFVKKGVSWALRMLGRRSVELNAAAVAVARRLAESESAAARWVGRGAVKELTSAAVVKKLKPSRG